MSTRSSTVLERIWSFGDLPVRGLDDLDLEARRTFRMLGVHFVATMLFATPFALLNFATGQHAIGAAILALDGVLIGNLLLLRRHRSAELASLVAVVVSLIQQFAEAHARGGFYTPSADFLLILPIIATLIGRIRVGLVITAATLLGTTLLWFAAPIPTAAMATRDPLELAIRLSVVASFGFLFWWTRIEARSLADLIEATRGRLTKTGGDSDPEAEVLRLLPGRQADAIEALASSVAHELNNPLAAAMGHVDLARQAAARGDREGASERLERATLALNRVTGLVQDLRGYSRLVRASGEAIDLGSCLETALKLADNELRHAAEVDVLQLSTHPSTHGAAEQWVQVFVHLLRNAAQSIEPGNARMNRIVVTLRDNGDDVEVTIDDTGCGIPDALREHVFDPFFTTRPAGTAAGLGLFVARNVVEHAGGTITLRPNEPGTRVTIRAPRADP